MVKLDKALASNFAEYDKKPDNASSDNDNDNDVLKGPPSKRSKFKEEQKPKCHTGLFKHENIISGCNKTTKVVSTQLVPKLMHCISTSPYNNI